MSNMTIYPDTYSTGTTNGRAPTPLPTAFLIRIPGGTSVSCERCGETVGSDFDLDWKHRCQDPAP